MVDILVWPATLLKPSAIQPNIVAFTRSGGRTLGGLERVTRTDRGWWSIAYKGVSLNGPVRRRAWNAMRVHAGGMAGLFALPVWSYDSAPPPPGAPSGLVLSAHADGATFSDGARYAQQAIAVETAEAVALGATSMTLRLLAGIDTLSGVRFSYGHALYETGAATLVDGDVWTVPVTPAVRAPIPAGAELEFALPTCLVRLAGDREMDVMFSVDKVNKHDVAFVEAADYWNDLAGA